LFFQSSLAPSHPKLWCTGLVLFLSCSVSS
jgi:hypothetical protein